MLFYSWNTLSWEKARSNLYRLQKRIFKSVLVGDLQKCLQIQKLLISSNSACLLAIRLVSQTESKLTPEKKLNLSLSFTEKFDLVRILQKNSTNWSPQKSKNIFFRQHESSIYKKGLFTFADKCWQTLITFALEPAHEAIFSPRNFGSRNSLCVYDAQKLLFLNLNKASYGFQKRVLILKFRYTYESFDYNILLKKIIAPRSIKLGIFRFLKSGFYPCFNDAFFSSTLNLENLLANVMFHGVESISNSVRYGSNFLIFLNPADDESLVITKLNKYFSFLGSNFFLENLKIYSVYEGFNFLNWHFKLYNNSLYCSPSIENYRNFLKRVKLIINNSNYGSSVKVLKINPIIKEWKMYNKFCNLKNFKTSLFFLQKKAFNSFNKESKNDRYSTRRLIAKSFLKFDTDSFLLKKGIFENFSSHYDNHVLFWFGYKEINFDLKIDFSVKKFCIHCGLNISDIF